MADYSYRCFLSSPHVIGVYNIYVSDTNTHERGDLVKIKNKEVVPA